MMDSKQEKSSLFSRRNFITKLGIFLAGGIAGHGTSFASTPAPTVAAAPPLPWKWVKLVIRWKPAGVPFALTLRKKGEGMVHGWGSPAF